MKKVLLVEDDPFLTEIYGSKLKDSGFSVILAPDGEGCLKKMEQEIPDLILLDIVLPGVDGWEVLRKIQKEDKFKKIKIVILSNLGQKDDVEKGLKFGATKYLIKAHYAPSEVIEEIKKILK